MYSFFSTVLCSKKPFIKKNSFHLCNVDFQIRYFIMFGSGNIASYECYLFITSVKKFSK